MSDELTASKISELLTERVRRIITRQCVRTVSFRDGVSPEFGRVHQHPHREILIALDGVCSYRFSGGALELTPGDVVLIDSWDEHGTEYAAVDRHLCHLWCYFIGNRLFFRLCEVLLHGNYRFIGGPLFGSAPLFSFVMNRWNEYNTFNSETAGATSAEPDLFFSGPLLSILDEVRIRMRIADVGSSSPGNDGDDMISAVKLHIDSRNGRECSLQELENLSGYNRFYLAHQFKSVTGMTLGDYINRVRLAFFHNARQRGLKQKEIASELGFSSSSSFWKWLRNNRDDIER